MNNVISKGKNVYNYVAKNLKSARRQIAYYTIPADIRAGTNHKFQKSSFTSYEINQFTEVNKAINDLPAVKSTKL